MTAPTKGESQSVQLVESAAVGKLPPEVQHQLELRKLSNQIAGELAKLNWGKALDLPTRRAIADWGRQYNVDVTTEINVLGGNVYLNSHYHLRRLGDLINAGFVEYAYADHVEDDPRLAQLGPEGEGEATRRLRQRIMHRIPDQAASAVVFRVKLRSMDREIVGVKWCGGGTRKQDPVGDAFPVETSESRAARRAMRLIVSHVPPTYRDVIEETDSAAESLSERIRSAQHQFSERERELAFANPPMALPAQGDPYGPVATVDAASTTTGGDVTPPPAVSTPAAVAPAPAVVTSSAPSPTGESTPAPATFDTLTAEISRLLKHGRLSAEQRQRFAAEAAEATSTEQLEELLERVESVIETGLEF